MMNIIFDIGNVICEWNPGKLIDQIINDSDGRQEILEEVFIHDDWHELDKGSITLEEAIANAVSRCSLEPDKIEALYNGTPASLIPFPSAVKVIHDLSSRGFPLYVLSNMQKHCWEYLTTSYDFWNLFTGIVVSYKVNLIKPDPEIYRYILKKYDLEPANTLYLDDMIENINVANNFNLNTIHVMNSEDYISDLYNAVGIQQNKLMKREIIGTEK
jgi:putative hydrolase of the HAD superfamily